MALDAALIDEGVEGEGAELFLRKLEQILGTEIDDETRALVQELCRVYFADDAGSRADLAPEAMAADRQRQQRLASARAHDPDAFAKRYPGAARIKNLGGR
jgi:hypothetical protein